MRVLKNNYNEKNEHIAKVIANPYPRKHICDRCSSELEYERSDLHMGFLGCMHLTCPLCGNENMVEENEGTVTLTKDNIEFPTHFWHTSVETGAKDCCNNNEVKNCIDKAIKYFRENKEEYSYCTSYGNLYVKVHRYEGDENYDVVVSNDFYETYIPFEKEDYRHEEG